MFCDLPGTDLITGEGSSRIEFIDDGFMTSGLGVHFGCADVEACVHRLRLREKMFVFLFGSQSKQRLEVIDGVRVPVSQLVHSTQLSLPMGFSWATSFAQSVSCKLVRESLPPLCSQRLTDRSHQEVLPCQDSS